MFSSMYLCESVFATVNVVENKYRMCPTQEHLEDALRLGPNSPYACTHEYAKCDAFRAVTKIAVREARLKEIKVELSNSRKLKTYFEDNPRDLQILRHDKSLHIVKLDSHLKNISEYIVPPVLKNVVRAENMLKHKKKPNNKRAASAESQETKSQMKYKRMKQDSLKSFQFEGLAALQKLKKEKKKKK